MSCRSSTASGSQRSSTSARPISVQGAILAVMARRACTRLRSPGSTAVARPRGSSRSSRFRRRRAAARASKTITVLPSTLIQMTGSDIYCTVLKSSNGTAVACFHDPGGPTSSKSKGYAIAASDAVRRRSSRQGARRRRAVLKSEPSLARVPVFSGGQAHKTVVHARPGRRRRVGGTHMAVFVTTAKGGGNAIGVIYVDGSDNAVVGTYTVGISNHYVTLVKVTASQTIEGRLPPRCLLRSRCVLSRMRLNAWLARAGVASRRGADELIKAGRVTVNGEPGQLNTFVGGTRPRRARWPAAREAAACLRAPPQAGGGRHDGARPGRPAHGRRAGRPSGPRRAGRTARRRHDRGAAPDERRRARAPAGAPALRGRQGLRRRRRRRARRRTLAALEQGVELDDGRTSPARARRLGPGRVELVIHEGRKHQVKRMLDAVGRPAGASTAAATPALAPRRPPSRANGASSSRRRSRP